MGSMTNYLENVLLEGTVKATTYTAPANVYLALFSTVCSDTAAGTEITGNGYARQEITFGTAALGEITSTANVSFTASGGNWGSVVATGIMDASTGGNLLYYDTINKVVNDGETLTFESGKITVSMD